MALFNVTIPITGVYSALVQADSEEEAIDRALSLEYGNLEEESDPTYDGDSVEWDVCRHIVTGNVFHGRQNDASAKKE